MDTYCYGSLDSTVTIKETAGVGGHLTAVDFTAREAVTGASLTTLHLSGEDIRTRAGTDRIEPMGSLAVRPIIQGYPVPASAPRPQLVIDVAAQMTDDHGNVVNKTKRVPVS